MAQHDKLFSFPVRVSDEVERLFNEIIHRPWGFAGELRAWNPSVDLYETPEAFILEADLPGVDPHDVKVEVEGKTLILQGKRSFQRNHSSETFFFQERSCGDFIRRIVLPESVDKEKITAEFKEGVLQVVLPKLSERSKEGHE
jgi:HSP20 family protein